MSGCIATGIQKKATVPFGLRILAISGKALSKWNQCAAWPAVTISTLLLSTKERSSADATLYSMGGFPSLGTGTCTAESILEEGSVPMTLWNFLLSSSVTIPYDESLRFPVHYLRVHIQDQQQYQTEVCDNHK
jgi:hypothetical protein